MRRQSGWTFAGVACTVLAGCGDLTVTGTQECKGSPVPEVSATITNKGAYETVLGGWEKPWVTMYPNNPFGHSPDAPSCSEFPNWCSGTSPSSQWLQPVATGSANDATLKPGDTVTLKLGQVPAMPAQGAYDLIIEVDPYHNYTESDESNNKAIIAINPCG